MSFALRLGNLFGGRQQTGTLEDGELTLQPPIFDDFADWRDLREESRQFLAPWEPAWPVDDLTRGAFARRIAHYAAERQRGTGAAWFLRDRAGNLLGGVALANMRGGAAKTGSIGYWVGERHAGKGHMTRALALVLPHAFARHDLTRIEAICLPRNDRSIRLLQRAGFRREGLLRECLEIAGVRRDHLLYGLLARDCRPGPAEARR